MSKTQEYWYIAITKDRAGFYNSLTAYGPQIENAKAFATRRGLEIVAEQEGLTEDDMDYLTGAILAGSDDRGLGAAVVGPEHLLNLIRKLNRSPQLDPQQELTRLYESKP